MESKIKPPIFNQVPFKKIKIPVDLYSDIKKEYETMKFKDILNCKISYEKVYGTHTSAGVSILGSNSPYYYKDEISPNLYDRCYDKLTPIMEEWCGKKLEKTWGYGVRSYVKNSILQLHRDRVDTHIISCIIYIDQKSEINWPLDFYDHSNNHHQVFFDDGDMLLYESLCVHGRETPFRGKYYRNMYFHWKPLDWDSEKYKFMKTSFKNSHELRNFYR